MRNRTSYMDFNQAMKPFGVFNTLDIKKWNSDFDSRRLVEWRQKGYLTKLSNKIYCFSDFAKSELHLYRISNKLYPPSYVSLETALWHSGLIPEAAFTIQAISSRKTIQFSTDLGVFNYRNLKPELYFGYTILRLEDQPILIAEPEKALLDLLYLNHTISTKQDLEALRLNPVQMSELDWEKLDVYRKLFHKSVLDKKVKILKTLYQNDQS